MENKTSKYFKYAIGEIVLVVVGILIALQINNWNENRKDRIQELELLTQLKSEFQSNLEQLDEKIEIRNNMIFASLKLLDYVDHPEKRNTDSILKYISPTLIAPTFDPIVNDISSSGRIQFITNSNLKEKLSRWTSEIIQVTEEEVGWKEARFRYTSTLMAHYPYRTVVNQNWKYNFNESFLLDKAFKTKLEVNNSKKNIDISNLLDDSNFEGHIALCASFSKITNIQSMSLRKRIVEILELINEELKK